MADMNPASKSGVCSLEERLGYRFHDPARLILALTHSTYSYENRSIAPEDNERLEYLGDAVLDLFVSQALFRCPESLSEGVMSRMRASLVCESSLFEIALELGIGAQLLLGRGEEGTGGRTKPSNLSNAMEAILGAIFLDGGWDAFTSAAERLFSHRIERTVSQGILFDAKSRLLEVAQASSPPVDVIFSISREDGPIHERIFTAQVRFGESIRGEGTGVSKKEAEQAAARAVLDSMRIR